MMIAMDGPFRNSAEDDPRGSQSAWRDLIMINVFWLNRHWSKASIQKYRADPGNVDAAADLSSCQRHLIRDR
jgi:hypothetical protein